MPLTPSVIDLILILIAIEFAILLVWLGRVGRRDLLPALIYFLLSGAAILAALRFAIAVDVNAAVVLALLGLSFPLHILTLVCVWKLVKK